MAKIESLTPEQTARLATFRAEWFRIGTDTARADRAKAEAAMLSMRAEIGIATKPVFIWCESPATGLLALSVLTSPQWAKYVGDLKRDFPASLGASLWASLGGSLRDSLGASLSASLGASLRASLGEIGYHWWGQHESYWIAFYLFCRDVVGVTYDVKRSRQLDRWRDIAQSCSWWWSFENYMICCERPTVVTMDERERIHAPAGPSIAFADGWQVHAWHGVRVPARLIEQPETITAEEILAEKNSEIQRVMLDRFGAARFLRDVKAAEIARDEFGVLYQTKQDIGGERLTMVRVLNSTPEPDGTLTTAQARKEFGADVVSRALAGRKPTRGQKWKEYFLRVHPECRPMRIDGSLGDPQKLSARAAVASTFGLLASEYGPEVET